MMVRYITDGTVILNGMINYSIRQTYNITLKCRDTGDRSSIAYLLVSEFPSTTVTTSTVTTSTIATTSGQGGTSTPGRSLTMLEVIVIGVASVLALLLLVIITCVFLIFMVYFVKRYRRYVIWKVT